MQKTREKSQGFIRNEFVFTLSLVTRTSFVLKHFVEKFDLENWPANMKRWNQILACETVRFFLFIPVFLIVQSRAVLSISARNRAAELVFSGTKWKNVSFSQAGNIATKINNSWYLNSSQNKFSMNGKPEVLYYRMFFV